MSTPLEQAFHHAFQTRWANTEYGKTSIQPMMGVLLQFLKDGNYNSLDDITSITINGFVGHLRNGRQCREGQINKYLSMLAMVLLEALKARPPLTTNTMEIPRVKVPKRMKWWLRPEELDGVLAVEGLTPYLRALIGIMVHNGLRVREVLALRPYMVDLTHNTVQVPGTKTNGAARTIPIYPKAITAFQWVKLEDPYGVADYTDLAEEWREVKEKLGIKDPDATLRALRRTFAAYATSAGMPTAVLRDVMGHENIATTEGYLNLVGNGRTEESRKYMEGPVYLRWGHPLCTKTPRQVLVDAMKAHGFTDDMINQHLKPEGEY